MVDSTLYEIVRSFDNSITSGRKYNRVNGGTVWKFIAFRKRNRLPQPPLDLVQLNDRNLDRFSITSPHGNTNGLLDKFPRLACFRLTWPRLLCRDPVSPPPLPDFPPLQKNRSLLIGLLKEILILEQDKLINPPVSSRI